MEITYWIIYIDLIIFIQSQPYDDMFTNYMCYCLYAMDMQS